MVMKENNRMLKNVNIREGRENWIDVLKGIGIILVVIIQV